MGEKWAVGYENDLDKGLCFLAKEDVGKRKVALFDSKEEAEKWVKESGDIARTYMYMDRAYWSRDRMMIRTPSSLVRSWRGCSWT